MNIFFLIGLGILALVQAEVSIEERKLQTLARAKELTQTKGVISLTGAEFNDIVRAPRDFSVVVALTVLDESFDCGPCKILDGLLKRVGSQWSQDKDSEKVFLTSLEYSKAPAVFAQYKLTTAPNLYIYPPNEKQTPDPKYVSFTGLKAGIEPQMLVDFINDNQDAAKVKYRKPTDWIFVGMIVSAFVIASGAAYFAYYKLGQILASSRSWSAIAIIFLLTMLSGQMWNNIRGPNFATYRRDGSLEWFASGFQDQLGLESQIVAVVYGLATFVLIKLGLRSPQVKSPALQSVSSILLILIFTACMAFITCLFRRKFSAYPYKIIFE